MFEIAMRAARLLQILLILQNRGRTTSRVLAEALEVTPRTILRDVDAMTEAGLPILVTQGHHGGIELGFNYRTRLTGLAVDEAEALALWLSFPPAALAETGMLPSADRARNKLIESFPDRVRATMAEAATRFRLHPPAPAEIDPRIEAMAKAIRAGSTVHLRARSASPQTTLPTALIHDAQGWHILCEAATIPLEKWGDINIARS